MATNAPQNDFHKTGLRLPRDLHAKLHHAAAGSGRSYNSEIVARLEASFAPGVTPGDALKAGLDQQIREVTSNVEAVEMQLEMFKTRLSSVQLRHQLLVSEFRGLAEQPNSEANIENLEKLSLDMKAAEEEIEEIREGLKITEKRRAALIGDVAKRRAKLVAFQTELEQELEANSSRSKGSL